MQRLIHTTLKHAIRVNSPHPHHLPATLHLLPMSTTSTPPSTTPPSNLAPTPTAPCRLLGVRFTQVSPQRVQAQYTVTEDHLQPASILHGGVNALIGEEVASTGAGLNAPPHQTVVGTRITLNHIRSAVEGDEVTVTAVPVHLGKQIQLWEIRVEKLGKEGGENKLLSIGDMQAFVRQRANNSKL